MNEAVPAQHRVGRGQSIDDDVRAGEADPIGAIESRVPLDQVADDVHADIAIERPGEVLHPVEIAARRIEQRPDAVALEDGRQLTSNGIGRGRAGPATGGRFRIAPQILVVDSLEDLPAMRAAADAVPQCVPKPPRLQTQAIDRAA